MIISCPDCELQVSDKAIACPHCGYPMKPNTAKRTYNYKNKRRKLPNGFGGITKLNDPTLRKPYRAMVTVGKNSKGKPITKILKPDGYFSTYNEAYEALMKYNKNPYDLDTAITVSELYTKWSEYYFSTLKSASSKRTIIAAWRYCSSVYDMRASDVRARHIKGCMDDGVANVNGEERRATPSTKGRIKSMFNLMFDYALEHEIVDRNYARTFDISDDVKEEREKLRRGHIIFNDDEMKLLWDNVYKVEYVDVVLIQCYSGWRPQELGLIRMENVDLKKWVFVGGMKTKAGRDRPVPIHPKIRGLVKAKYDEALQLGSEYLINCTDATTHRSNNMLTYDKYQKRFIKIRERLKLNPDHRAHDGRVHFITMAKKYEVDEYAIKYIIGHSINDITENVYTHRDIEWLRTEIEKIK